MVMNHTLQIEFSVKTLNVTSLHMYTYSTYLKIGANNPVQLYTEPRNTLAKASEQSSQKGILMNKITSTVRRK
jgi:hypothetical protein